jgi:hypothetical protein
MDSLLFEAPSGMPLTFDPQRIHWQTPVDEKEMVPTDKMGLIIWISSTYTRDIEVCCVINSTARDTWIELPGVQFPLGGTDNHQLLSRRDQDVASEDPVKADPCHPWSALGPAGRLYRTLGTATLAGEGTTRILVMPDDSSVAKLVPETSEVIYGIDRTGFEVDDTSNEIRVHVFATVSHHVTFVHNAAATAGADAVYLRDVAKNIELTTTTILRFVRDPDTGSGIWRLLT